VRLVTVTRATINSIDEADVLPSAQLTPDSLLASKGTNERIK